LTEGHNSIHQNKNYKLKMETTTINQTLPVYKVVINDKQGLFAISLVNSPATSEEFYAFDKHQPTDFKFQTVNADKRIITGIAMVPNLLLYRNDLIRGEYNMYFDEETIRTMVRNYFSEMKINSFTLEHSKPILDGMTIEESYFLSDNLKSTLFPNGKSGSWVVSLYVYDNEVWDKFVKSGAVKGFSIEVLADIALQFSDMPKCNITTEMVQMSEIKQAYIDEDFDSLNFETEVELQKWNSPCQCNNCKKLKSFGYTLAGVLPDMKDKIKTHSVK
jgi:hypothetical protein